VHSPRAISRSAGFEGGFGDALKSNKPVGGKAMSDKKDRDRVIAEITLSHLVRLGNEQGCHVSREQALAFLNHEGRAFEMWKHMMHAAEEFISGSLFQHSFSSGGHNGCASHPQPVRAAGDASL
jgi:hypothetical protein